jgi:hypothetical protein
MPVGQLHVPCLSTRPNSIQTSPQVDYLMVRPSAVVKRHVLNEMIKCSHATENAATRRYSFDLCYYLHIPTRLQQFKSSTCNTLAVETHCWPSFSCTSTNLHNHLPKMPSSKQILQRLLRLPERKRPIHHWPNLLIRIKSRHLLKPILRAV